MADPMNLSLRCLPGKSLTGTAGKGRELLPLELETCRRGEWPFLSGSIFSRSTRPQEKKAKKEKRHHRYSEDR